MSARVHLHVDAALATIDVAAVVSAVRGRFARRHVLADARRHLLETPRGLESRGLDEDMAGRASSDRNCQATVPRSPVVGPRDAAQLFHTADFADMRTTSFGLILEVAHRLHRPTFFKRSCDSARSARTCPDDGVAVAMDAFEDHVFPRSTEADDVSPAAEDNSACSD